MQPINARVETFVSTLKYYQTAFQRYCRLKAGSSGCPVSNPSNRTYCAVKIAS
ncbi:hypothetical protein SAMN05421509_10311 [Chromohalobacter canadensis]|uniref:Uncharacterized protein n=1 Tax=Chromohalobacter canadensis TaxID=141389 RepID=A0A285VIH9_9GAMM|nr:hypothetical protein [Chromohalobacter canadensis]SOC53914.1 hypothetical protein SAMN05421509_10311 [Chromohalobacter canadensis]